MRSLCTLLMLPLMLCAQPEFFGYFESEVDAISISKINYQFGYHKFRLDLEARPNDNVLVGANMNVQQYWGQTTWNLLDFLPESVWKPLFQNENVPEANWIYELPFAVEDTLLLDNVYARIRFPMADLTFGRQQISPGVGYAWNPTDIFNTKSLLDPSYEQTGVSAIRTELSLASRLTLNAVIQPGADWERSTKQISIKSGIAGFDLELTNAEYEWKRSNFTLVGIAASKTKRTLLGGSLVGEMLEWGVWLEGAQNTLAGDDDFDEVVVGTDHTFDNSLYVLFEYLHNGNGMAEKGELTFDAYVRSFSGETHSLMQDYGFLYLMHPSFDYVTLSAIAIANFNDGSGSFGPQIDWNIFEDTTVSCQSTWYIGADDTEFGLQDWGLRLRLLSNF